MAQIGAPSVDFPGIQEAIDFNKSYGLWISAPPGTMTGKANYYGGMYFTTLASMEEFYQESTPENPSFLIETFAGGSSPYSGGSTAPTYTSGTSVDTDLISNDVFTLAKVDSVFLSYPTVDDATSTTRLELTIAGTDLLYNSTIVGSVVVGATTTQIIINSTPAAPEFDFTAAGTLDTWLTANSTSIDISWVHNIQSEAIMTLYQNSPREVETEISVSMIDLRETIPAVDGVDNPNLNTVTFSFREKVYGSSYYSSPSYTVSPDFDKVNGFNASIFLETILDGNTFISGKAYKDFTDSTGTWEWETDPDYGTVTTPVSGTRVLLDADFDASTDLGPTLQMGWDAVAGPEFEDIRMFFDPEAMDSLKTNFSNLRNTTHKFSTFISGIKVSQTEVDAAVGALQTARSSLPNLTGLAYYCNEFLTKENYTGTEFWTIPVGAIASRLTRIMEVRYGGAAPMFTNSSNGLGGQIDKVVRKAKYYFTADDLDALDGYGINPVVLDNYYGLMITSQRTAQSPITLTDWSYLGHQMAFDLFKAEVKKNVMIPQIGKPINPFYMDLRQSQTEAILNKRLIGANAIWDFGEVLVEEVNTATTRAENKFVIKVRVRVNPFSETVELVFNNLSQLSTTN